MTRQVTDQLYIDLGYFTPEDYYTYEAVASAAISSTATVTATITVIGVPTEASANLTSAFTQSSQINITASAASSQTSAFTQTAIAGRIKQGAIALTDAFTPTLTVDVFKNSTSVIECVATVTADTVATRVFNITLESIVTQSLQSQRLAGLTSNQSAQFSISASADNRTQEGTASLSTTATASATANKIRFFNASFTSAFTQTTIATDLADRPLTAQTPAGSLSFDTSIKQFGSASLFSNTGTAAWWAGNDVQLTTNQMFLSGWYRPSTAAINAGSDTRISTSPAVWRLDLDGSTEKVEFKISADGFNYATVATSSSSLVANTWYHIAVSKSGTSYAIWINGNRVATGSYFDTPYNTGINTPQIWIGNSGGHYDEWEMQTDTYGQYNPSSTTYTVPTQESANTDNTEFLFHFNGNYNDDNTGQLSAALTATASLTAIARRTRVAASAMSSTALLTGDGIKVVEASANLTAEGFVVTANGRIRSQLADLDTAFALTASVDVVVNFDCAMTSTCTLSATGLDIDFASAQLTTAVTLTTTAIRTRRVAAALTTTATLTAQPDNIFLQLIYGAGNTSGFITSTGTTIVQSFTDTGQAPEQYGYGWWPVHLNFWVKINTALSTGETLTLYTGGNTSVYLRNVSGSYFVDVTLIGLQSEQNNGFEDNYTRYSTTSTCRIPLGSNNPVTDFVNIDCRLVPFINQTWRVDPALFTARAGIDWGSPKVNGADVSESITTTNTELTTSPGFVQPSLPTVANGGQWGANTNATDVYLDQVWVDNLGANTVPPVTDFIVDGQQANITGNGTTASSLRAQVWLPWGTLLDRSNLAPTWNYTATNRVIPGLVKQGEASFSSQATQTTIFTRVTQGQAAVSASTALSVPGRRVRFAQVSATSAFAQTASATKAALAQASLTTTATQTTNIKKFVGASCAMSTAFAQTTQERRLRDNPAALTSQATQTVVVSKFTGVISNQTATFTQTVVNGRIRDVNTQFESIATEVTAAFKNATGTVLMESAAALNAVVRVVTDTPVTMLAQATVLAEPRTLVDAEASMSAQVQMTTEATKFRPSEANLTTSATQTAQAVKTARGVAQLTSTSTLSVTPTRVLQYASDQTAQVSVTVIGSKFRQGAAALTSQSTITALVTNVVRFNIALQAQGFVLSDATVIHIDPYTTYMIPQETRNTLIAAETRLYVINQETRVNTIIGSTL